MFGAFLKRFGLALIGAVLTALATTFADPTSYTALGAYAAFAAVAGALIAGLFVKIRDRNIPK